MNSNILIDVAKIPELLKQDYQFIDIRDTASFKREHLMRFKNIPIDQFSGYKQYINKNVPVVFICYSGNQSHQLAQQLNQEGYKCYSVYGGYYNLKAPKPNSSYF
ncbi:MAG: rhodanese-like domain-containing protein [Coprobacillaceae bacterium]